MKRTLDFFNVTSLLEEISEKEASMLKGGDSDIDYEVDLDEVEVIAPIDDDWPDIDPDPDDDFDPYDPGDDYDPTQDDGWDNDSDGSPNPNPVDPTPNPSGTSDNIPWVRDADGNIEATPTGVKASLKHGEVTLNFEEYKIKTEDGLEVTVYKTESIFDESINALRDPTDAEKSNCFGLVLADGDFWFWDNTDTANADEFSGLLNLRDTFYMETTKDDATMAIIYDGANTTYPIHNGFVNPDGSFTAKGGVGEVGTYDSEFEFRNPNGPDPNIPPHYTGDIVYYKPKF